jgi:hypothetical protein
MPLTVAALLNAAREVRCGAPVYGEFWRRVALARLAARSTTDHDTVAVEHELAASELAGIVGSLQDALTGIVGLEPRFIVAYKVVVPTGSTEQVGMPTCESTPPSTTTSAQNVLASGNTSVWLHTGLTQITQKMDPQAWHEACGHLVFPDTHIAKHTTIGGPFDIDQGTCTAKSGIAYVLGTKWNDDLFENFVPMTYASSFVKNILTIDVKIAPPFPPGNAYKMHYGINKGLQGQIGGSTPLTCGTPGLYLDDGDVTAIDGGKEWAYLAVSKQLIFTENFLPGHKPADLAADAAVAMHALLDALPWLVCCPPTFP